MLLLKCKLIIIIRKKQINYNIFKIIINLKLFSIKALRGDEVLAENNFSTSQKIYIIYAYIKYIIIIIT